MLAHHYIAHRVNKSADLNQLPTEYGVELDIRPYTDQLIIEHDPYLSGDSLEAYLSQYHHGTLILNIKAERVEFKVLEYLEKYNITDYFFLDCSFPMIYQLSKQGEKKIALRYSEFEGLDTIKIMQGKVEWVWIDCFTHLPLDRHIYQQLKNWGYKLCLVSPELQGQPEKIAVYKQQLMENEIVLDAICTKLWNIPLWKGQKN